MRRPVSPLQKLLVWIAGACGLVVVVIDHPFQSGPLRTIALICTLTIIGSAILLSRLRSDRSEDRQRER